MEILQDSDARAVAVLKGSLNGSEIAGTVKFSQSVRNWLNFLFFFI